MSPQRRASRRKAPATRGASPKVKISRHPTRCPHCGGQGFDKTRGAHNTLSSPELGCVIKWFHVRCKACERYYILRESHKSVAK